MYLDLLPARDELWCVIRRNIYNSAVISSDSESYCEVELNIDD